MKKLKLTEEESTSLRKSLRDIYALFLSCESIKPQYLTCVIKWGIQLRLNLTEIHDIIENVNKDSFHVPSDKTEAMQGLYDIVHLIYLDDVVEDIELEVASQYAEALGYKPYLVSDILKTIVTASFEGLSDDEIREELKNLVELNYLT